MQGNTTKQIMSDDFWMPYDQKELEKIYRTLAKAADQRLVRLEAYQHDKGFKPATEWAYARAQRDIQAWSGAEANRFNTAPPASKVDLVAKINDIKHFLQSPTSTKQGIIDVYAKRAASLNETMRAKDKNWKDLTWKDLAQYFDSALHEKLDKQYGSKTMFKAINRIKQKEKEIAKDIKEKKDIHEKVSADMTDIVVNNILKKYPAEVKDFLNLDK